MATPPFKFLWSYLSKSLSEFGTIISPYITVTGGGPTPDANNNLIVANSSTYTVVVGNGESHLIDNFSGMLIVNDHWDGGVELWVCGGGSCTMVVHTEAAPGNSTMSMQNNGYEWTNVDNLGSNGVGITFTVIKTRNSS